MAIKSNAGQIRGIRAVRDPDGVLLDPFTDPHGMQIGYIIVYGEGLPAVYDGETWHPITDETEEEWTNNLQTRIVEQGTKIIEAAKTSEIYSQLAQMMNIMVPSGVNGAPNEQTLFF